MLRTLSFATRGRGLLEITAAVAEAVQQAAVGDGLATLFVQHTSCSLLIQENADPTARGDLQRWLDRLLPDGDALHRHTAEGPDDMPSHLKAMLLPTSLSIPLQRGRLCLGTWQGIYLFEHRLAGSERRVVLQLLAG